ncbi:MAG: glycosyltransferase [Verrucomicrobia bacterium]|nr:glycosyltransferase [Verrucomicrobiota bacterium]
MRFTIVTPSFRHSRWLKLCVASVADQEIEHEHIVQDACSDDGTQDWLPQDRRVLAVIEKDRGMYDAINRGFRRARGELLAYLNCDEQYLPGALRTVSEFFDRHPEVEVVFADCVVIDPKGNYICDRKALTPQRAHTLVSDNLSFLTAATFLRRRVIEERQLFFDPRWRDLGDGEWATRLIQAGVRMAVLRAFTSAFTETGHNMNLGPNASQERKEFAQGAPAWARLAVPLVVAHFRLRRLLSGAYFCQPHHYAVYTEESPDRRRTFQVDKPTFRWVR